MLHLLLDSGTKYLYVAVFKDNELLGSKYQVNFRDHSSFIIPFIQEVLNKAKINFNDLDDITIGNGPGSYTGLRIAGTVAKTISYLINKPLYEISTLYLLTSGYNELRLVQYDARNNRAFATVINEQDEIILKDMLIEDITKFSKDYQFIIELNQNDITDLVKIDFKKIVAKRVLVKDSSNYTPNYCLKTKAEQDHDQSN